MQVFICVICKVNRPPLYPLNFEHRQIFEEIVSRSVNITELKKCGLLTCMDCQRQIQTVLVFQQTAVVGARHLLKLLPLIPKKTNLADPLQVQIKSEQTEDSPTGNKPFIEIEVEPEIIGTLSELNIDFKNEPDNDSSATASCESDGEDSTEAHTIKNEVVLVQKPQNLAMLPPGTALDSWESRSGTSTRRRPAGARGGRGAAAAGRGITATGRGGHKTTNPSLVTLLQKTVKVPKPPPKPSPASTSTVPADTDEPADTEQAQTKGSPWYIRVLTDEEMAAERLAASRSAAFAAAPHRCQPCVQAFASAPALAAHAKLHLASAGPYLCRICTQRMRSAAELAAHRARHAERYCCCYCRHSAPDRQAAARHSCDLSQLQWQKTTFSKHLDGRRRTYPKPVKCKQCFAGFANDASLAVHTAKYHSKPPVPAECNVCGKVFKSKFFLKKHSYTHKKKSLLESPQPELLYCTECKLAFETQSGYRSHRLSLKHCSKDNWKFECDYCGKKCPNKADINMHIQLVHCTEREFKCDKCPKSFVRRYQLKKHGESHAQRPRPRPRPHVCERCGKAFTARKTLAEHLNIHEGLRPYVCSLCPATFQFKAALFTHNRLKHLKIKREWKKKPKKAKEEEKDEIKDDASPEKC